MVSKDAKVAVSNVAASTAAKLAAALIELREKLAAKLLEALIPSDEIQKIGPDNGLAPLPGKRWKVMSTFDHGLCIVRALKTPSKQQSTLMTVVMARLPPPLDGFDEATGVVPESLAETWRSFDRNSDRPTRVRALLTLLLDPGRRESVAQAIDSDYLAPPALVVPGESEEPPDPRDATIRRLEARIARQEAERDALDLGFAERERAFKLRIEQTQSELSELRLRLGKSHREIEELRALYETAKSDLELAFRRAARFKQTLDETKSHSDREKELLEAYAREKQRADIEASKVEILEYELDVLANDDEHSSAQTPHDYDRNPVFERIQRYENLLGTRPRILIVGGAGKQRSHRDRDFESMKARLGVDGEWRFADYGSWHRELPRLRNDIQHRFDLVFVLHWNRTTFVQKMHDEARALNGRVRTVPYRGFLSLERAILEEVDRFVQEHV